MTTTIEYIKQLREITGAGILECRTALEGNNYNYKGALADLKELAVMKAGQKSGREAVQGMVEVYTHGGGRIGVMVEVNCETDFTARSTRFRAFTHEIALQIAAASPLWVAESDIPADVLEQESSKAITRARTEGKSETFFPRISEGTLKKYMDRTVLLRQASIHDETFTVAQLLAQTAGAVGENIIIRRFVRWELAEGMEKE
jgi:elongation factor Ts